MAFGQKGVSKDLLKTDNMKRLALLMMIVLVGTTIAMAQNRNGQRELNPEKMAKQQTEELKKDLKLDRVQVDKMEKYLSESNKELVKLREELKGEEDRFKIRDAMREFRTNQEKGIKKILKPEQLEKYNKMLEERSSRKGRGPGRG